MAYVPFTQVLRTMLKYEAYIHLRKHEARNRFIEREKRQLYGEVFERLSVKGGPRKVFHKVWRVVVGQLSVLEESKHQG